MMPDENRTAELLRVIEAEYREMPGLRLTMVQAQRLWSLDAPTCGAMFDRLITSRFLRRNHRDAYVMAGSSH
jgi:hypothetical protein